MDVQITPEPSPEEREAILRALAEERESEPLAWRAAALDDYEDPVGAGGTSRFPQTPSTGPLRGRAPN
ncbi:MAG: hypothetical protein WAQ33_10610, partial [Gaiellaceae bacterium]